MAQDLNNKKIAILLENGFEQVEMTQPRQALDEAGAQTHLVSPQAGQVQGWNHYDRGDQFPVDVALDQANPDDYDALLLPGGTLNPDQLRMNKDAVQFVRSFFDARKPVAAICHGPWTLAEADVVQGRKMTSWPSLRTDLRNAGASWVDRSVVVDRGLITSRNPGDIEDFNAEMLKAFAASEVAAV